MSGEGMTTIRRCEVDRLSRISIEAYGCGVERPQPQVGGDGCAGRPNSRVGL